MASWYAPTMAPRIHLGAVSDWYRGTEEESLLDGSTKIKLIYLLRAEIKPTPKPAKKRPARNMGIAVEMVWSTTPRLKTQVEIMRAGRRPKKSANRGEARAPKKVPAERMDTMDDSCEVVMSSSPLELRKPVLKRVFQ